MEINIYNYPIISKYLRRILGIDIKRTKCNDKTGRRQHQLHGDVELSPSHLYSRSGDVRSRKANRKPGTETIPTWGSFLSLTKAEWPLPAGHCLRRRSHRGGLTAPVNSAIRKDKKCSAADEENARKLH